jgi:RNA polymerase sigma-70 factor (ECF subfamily)
VHRDGGSVVRVNAAEFDSLAEPRLDADDPLPPENCAPASGSAMEGLYQTHANRLLRFFSRRAGPVDAPDLVHETFVRMAGIEPAARHAIESPGAFLTRIATNLLKDRAKMAVRRSAACHLVYDEQVHGSVDPDRLLNDRDALARLEAAVGRLNRRTREIFLLHRVEGMTYAEIADEVGMSVKGVKKQMAKALFQLRRDVGPL